MQGKQPERREYVTANQSYSPTRLRECQNRSDSRWAERHHNRQQCTRNLRGTYLDSCLFLNPHCHPESPNPCRYTFTLLLVNIRLYTAYLNCSLNLYSDVNKYTLSNAHVYVVLDSINLCSMKNVYFIENINVYMPSKINEYTVIKKRRKL